MAKDRKQWKQLTELSEQGGDRRSFAGYFTFHCRLLFPDMRYKKSDNLAILSNDVAFPSMFAKT